MKVGADELYAAARRAGWTDEQAVIATAVALSESGGRTDAVGDQALVDGTWGPSYGAWQIRTLHADLGTGRTRDLEALRGGLDAQATRAYEVWKSAGYDWRPWSVWTSGAYRQHLGLARDAAGREGNGTGAEDTSDRVPGALYGGAGLLAGVGPLLAGGLVLTAGLGLVLLGTLALVRRR